VPPTSSQIVWPALASGWRDGTAAIEVGSLGRPYTYSSSTPQPSTPTT
jgi:hypothetical protein